MSRWLLTRPLPVAPASIGYCGRNRRFVLRIYFHIEQSLKPHPYFARTLYPYQGVGFYVREGVALNTRNIPALGRVYVRGNRHSADAVWARTGHGPGLSAAPDNPCPRTVHEHVMATGRARTWTVHSLVESTDLVCPRFRPGKRSVHAQSCKMTRGSQLDRGSAAGRVNLLLAPSPAALQIDPPAASESWPLGFARVDLCVIRLVKIKSPESI